MTTILIVDDLEVNRRALVTLLRHHGHRVLEASDGAAGLATVRAEHPDLVITDVLMPVMDGYEFARQLRLDVASRQTPIVFYTANYGEREARALAASSGLAYVLTKPYDSRAVLEIIARALSTQARADVAPAPGAATGGQQLRLLTDRLSASDAELRTANARVRALVNIGLELASESDPERLFQQVCTAARDLFGATSVILGIVEPDGRTVQRIVACGTDVEGWIQAGELVPGVLATVVAERRTERGDVTPDALGREFLAFHPAAKSFLAAPLASPDRVYGWICLVGNERGSFSEDDEQLVAALAGQVGRIHESGELAAELRRERDRADRYLDTAEVILLKLDLEGRITLVNRYGCTTLGWSAADLVGRDWTDTCLPARTRQAFRDRTAMIAAGTLSAKDLSILENHVQTRSGEERLIEWRSTLRRDEEGRVIGTFSCGTDITDRTRAIEALQATEERTRFALEAAGVGIWDLDYTTGVLRWSEMLERQYGLAAGTFAGTLEAFVEGIHPDDREAAIETMSRVMRSGTDFRIEHRALWPDGRVRWLSGAGRIHLDDHGQPLRGVGISMDVTERRELEAQHHQAQRMEAIGRLAGGVAHDFNNLLTAILGYCEMLLADLEPADSRRAYVANIQKAGKSAAAVTRQLLAFSRKEIIEPKLLDLNGVVTDTRAMLGRLIRENVHVVLGLVPGQTPLLADRGALEQIVLNLVVNAQDAMPDGGTLTIETSCVDLYNDEVTSHAVLKPGPHVVLAVTDTGTGMAPEVLARVFEPFFTTKEVGKGTGFGLATVDAMVARSGGSITVASELGRGTSFKVYFPRALESAQVVEARPTDVQPRAGTETVLVVEDSEGVRDLARSLLQKQGYTVLVAANADEAVGLFERTPSIDLLLTDVVMPGGSGPELTRRLAGRWPTLKAIYMSGYTEEAIVQHGVIKPGIMFLHKPFTAEALGRKVREVLDP